MSGWIGIMLTLLLVGGRALAADQTDTPEGKFAAMRKLCVHQNKPRAACACVVKNIDTKFKNGQFSDQQLSDALAVFRKIKPAEEEASRVDAMADLIAGLEFHCVENSNYSGE